MDIVELKRTVGHRIALCVNIENDRFAARNGIQTVEVGEGRAVARMVVGPSVSTIRTTVPAVLVEWSTSAARSASAIEPNSSSSTVSTSFRKLRSASAERRSLHKRLQLKAAEASQPDKTEAAAKKLAKDLGGTPGNTATKAFHLLLKATPDQLLLLLAGYPTAAPAKVTNRLKVYIEKHLPLRSQLPVAEIKGIRGSLISFSPMVEPEADELVAAIEAALG